MSTNLADQNRDAVVGAIHGLVRARPAASSCTFHRRGRVTESS